MMNYFLSSLSGSAWYPILSFQSFPKGKLYKKCNLEFDEGDGFRDTIGSSAAIIVDEIMLQAGPHETIYRHLRLTDRNVSFKA